jgi:mRNA interferase HigB
VNERDDRNPAATLGWGDHCSHRGSMLRTGLLRIFSRSTLVDFWTKHPDAQGPLRLWFSIVQRASWRGPAEIRAVFGAADFLAGNRVVFDIKGNSYRLVVQFKYAPLFLAFIRFVGTHAEYDRIDANKV